MNVLVTVASKHGATGQIGQVVADTLRDAGLPVETRRPEQVTAVHGYDAVVLGSAIYGGRWLAPARSFAERFATELAAADLAVLERSAWQAGPACRRRFRADFDRAAPGRA